MGPPQDYLNLLYALSGNIRTIHFSSALDPVIEPIEHVRTFPHDIASYMDFFESADGTGCPEPLIVEYYKLKFRLKSFEDIVEEMRGEDPKDEFFPLQINDFVSNGTASDLYLAPFCVGVYFEDDTEETSLRFFEEAHRVASWWCNQDGVALCMDKIESLREKTGLDSAQEELKS